MVFCDSSIKQTKAVVLMHFSMHFLKLVTVRLLINTVHLVINPFSSPLNTLAFTYPAVRHIERFNLWPE